LAPAVFTVEFGPCPLELVAATFTSTRVSKDKLKGAARRVAIGTMQDFAEITPEFAPLHDESTL
jgi:hypothetical protein